MSQNGGSGSREDPNEWLDKALRQLGEEVLAEPVPERLLRPLREARARAGSQSDGSGTRACAVKDAGMEASEAAGGANQVAGREHGLKTRDE